MESRSPSKRLRRLDFVWLDAPVYFITCCSENRMPILADQRCHQILMTEWEAAQDRRGWQVGPYVIMPDHVHFFASPTAEALPLSSMVGAFKTWTSRSIRKERSLTGAVWQRGFFDHVLRSEESRSEKWDYMRLNPVRAGLCDRPEQWPYAGSVHFQ